MSPGWVQVVVDMTQNALIIVLALTMWRLAGRRSLEPPSRSRQNEARTTTTNGEAQ